jgi:hypothetical protein
MNHSVVFDRTMIAPCGINCGTCLAFLREKNRCNGCRVIWEDKAKSRVLCRIKNCEQLGLTESGFCYECERFPCKLIKHIDKRYRTKYKISLVQNLLTLKELWMTKYLEAEQDKWSCPNCGAALCVHRDFCLHCKVTIDKKPNWSIPSGA